MIVKFCTPRIIQAWSSIFSALVLFLRAFLPLLLANGLVCLVGCLLWFYEEFNVMGQFIILAAVDVTTHKS